MQRVAWRAMVRGLAGVEHQLPHPFEVPLGDREALLRRDLGQARAAGGLEVDGDPARQTGETLDLPVVGAGNQLDVDVPGKTMLLAKELEYLDEVVGDFR